MQRPFPTRQASMALLLSVLIAATSIANAQDTPATPEDPTSLEALMQRFEALETELEAAQAERAARPDSSNALDRRINRLTSIAVTLNKAIEERRVLDAPAAPVKNEAKRKPSMATLIDLYEEQERNRRRIEDLSQAAEAGRASGAAAEEAFRLAERERREARDAHDERPSPSATSRLEAARLASRAAQEEVYLRDLEKLADRAAEVRAENRAVELQQNIAALTATLHDDPSIGSDPDPALVAREGEARRRRESTQRALTEAERNYAQARARLQSVREPAAELTERVETLRVIRDAKAQELAALEAQLTRAASEQELQQRWLSVIRETASPDELQTWSRAADEAVLEQQRLAIQRQGRTSELHERLDVLRTRIEDPELSPGLKATLQERRDALRELANFLGGDARDLNRNAELQRRFLAVVRDVSGTTPLLDRLAAIGDSASALWEYEITTVDDDAITVGNAILALILISLGFTVSRRTSHGIRNVIESRFELEPGVSGAVQTAVFYVLLVTFVLLGLRTVNFPLTAFTVAGGALAIGIGFGSQNVMNNFISGLILMLERPVRSQDLVEVESTHGTIEHIGARSTRIRATDGRHIIVPNSFFLENNVVNWTLSDDLIRTKISVGVIYGSPTRLVQDLIKQVLEENEQILSQPAPIIIFQEFGDNSLNFDAYVWIRARRPMQVYQVASEVRFRIDDLFRENDLVIAFPQRDVHLDSVSPIEIKVVEGSASHAGKGSGADDPTDTD